MYEDLKKKIQKEFSSEIVRKEIYGIFKNDRKGTTPAFVRTGSHIYKRLKKIGLKEIKKSWFLADGKTLIQDWLPSPAWDCKEAFLKITEPKEYARTMVKFPDKFLCVGMNSPGTPDGGVTSQVILYNKSSDLKKARGKILFFSGRVDSIKNGLLKNDIKGVISDFHYKGKEKNDTIYWENRWHVKKEETSFFCIKISMKDGAALRILLEKGVKVKVKAFIRARNYSGKIPAVSGLIPGKNPKEEVIILGHVYDVGAHDNASGAGIMIEIARTIQKLIKTGKLSQPRRSIRFLFPHEMYGTLDWVARKRDKSRKLIAGLNLDMVGGKNNSIKLRASDEIPSFTNELIVELLKQSSHIRKGLIVSNGVLDDEMFLKDPLIGCSTPTLSFGRVDHCYHSDADTMDKLDYNFVKNAGVVSAVYLYFIASAGIKEALWLAELVFSCWNNSIVKYMKEKNSSSKINFLIERGTENLNSISALVEGPERAFFNKKIAGYICCLEKYKKALSGKEKPVRGEKLVPVRSKCSLIPAMDSISGKEKTDFENKFKEYFPWSNYLSPMWFLTDGKRTIRQIHYFLKNNYGTSDLKRLVEIYKFLKRTKYIKFR